MTVQQIIDIHDEKYLIWIYYNMSNISFMDDLLDYLCCNKIEFPGTAPEQTHFAQWKYREMLISRVTGLDFIKFNAAKNKKIKRSALMMKSSKRMIRHINNLANAAGNRGTRSDDEIRYKGRVR